VIAELAKRAAGWGDDPSRRGLLFAAGLITGEALMGIMLAIPIALTALWPGLGGDPFALFDVPPFGGWPGLMIIALVGAALYLVAVGSSKSSG
jgi:hypothetical protein